MARTDTTQTGSPATWVPVEEVTTELSIVEYRESNTGIVRLAYQCHVCETVSPLYITRLGVFNGLRNHLLSEHNSG